MWGKIMEESDAMINELIRQERTEKLLSLTKHMKRKMSISELESILDPQDYDFDPVDGKFIISNSLKEAANKYVDGILDNILRKKHDSVNYAFGRMLETHMNYQTEIVRESMMDEFLRQYHLMQVSEELRYPYNNSKEQWSIMAVEYLLHERLGAKRWNNHVLNRLPMQSGYDDII